MANKSSSSKKRQPSGSNLLSAAEKPKNPAGEQGRRGAVTGRKVGAQKLSANRKREITRRAGRARWS